MESSRSLSELSVSGGRSKTQGRERRGVNRGKTGNKANRKGRGEGEQVKMQEKKNLNKLGAGG